MANRKKIVLPVLAALALVALLWLAFHDGSVAAEPPHAATAPARA